MLIGGRKRWIIRGDRRRHRNATFSSIALYNLRCLACIPLLTTLRPCQQLCPAAMERPAEVAMSSATL